MTPVKKDHLSNLSQSISHNLSALAKHKYSEEQRLKKNFRELRQLLDTREKWLLDQLDQLTNSQLSILKTQKETLDEEVSLCKGAGINDYKFCLPLYKFSDAQMPSFKGSYEQIKDSLLQFGEISSQESNRNVTSESKSAWDAVESEKWLLQKQVMEKISSFEPQEFKKEDVDYWLMDSSDKNKRREEKLSDLVSSWTLRDQKTSCVPTTTACTIASPHRTNKNSGNTDYHQWIKRETCRLTCPAENNKSMWLKSGSTGTAADNTTSPSSATAVEIEDLTQLKCVTNEEPFYPTSVLLSPYYSSPDAEVRTWLANPALSNKRSLCQESSRCSSVSTFCEANEACSNFDECVADEGRCVSRYNDWLMTNSFRPSKPKASRLQTEDLSVWLMDRSEPMETNEWLYPVVNRGSRKTSFRLSTTSNSDSYDWFENGNKINVDYWLAKI